MKQLLKNEQAELERLEELAYNLPDSGETTSTASDDTETRIETLREAIAKLELDLQEDSVELAKAREMAVANQKDQRAKDELIQQDEKALEEAQRTTALRREELVKLQLMMNPPEQQLKTAKSSGLVTFSRLPKKKMNWGNEEFEFLYHPTDTIFVFSGDVHAARASEDADAPTDTTKIEKLIAQELTTLWKAKDQAVESMRVQIKWKDISGWGRDKGLGWGTFEVTDVKRATSASTIVAPGTLLLFIIPCSKYLMLFFFMYVFSGFLKKSIRRHTKRSVKKEEPLANECAEMPEIVINFD